MATPACHHTRRVGFVLSNGDLSPTESRRFCASLLLIVGAVALIFLSFDFPDEPKA